MSIARSAYLPEARANIDAAYVDYERRRPGLGDRLVEAVLNQVEVRAAPVRRFPYVVYYHAEENRVLIIAVQDGRRDWSIWQERVKRP